MLSKEVRASMRWHDLFSYEIPFEATKKGNKGTVIGFFVSVIYMVILWGYIFQQFSFFFTFRNDVFGETVLPLDLEDDGDKGFANFQLGVGVVLHTADKKYEDDIKNPDILSQYVTL